MHRDPAAPNGDPIKRAETFASSCIAEHWSGSGLESVEELRGDASSRAYLRLHLSAENPKAPATLIAMILADAAVALSSEELSVFGDGGPTELPFLNVARFLAKVTDALPRIEAISPDESVILLEDVGDTTLWDAASSSLDPEVEFRRALDWLAKVQHDATDDGSGCYAFEQSFDERLFRWEFEHFLEYGVSRAAPESLVTAAKAELDAAARALADLPQVFCHRDYHAWNLHIAEGRLRVIDYQDALMGPALYDVASLLTDRATPTLITAAREESLVDYFAGLVGADNDREGVHRAYRLCALQRTLKVVGRFNYLADVKGKPQYREMLADVVPTARRHLAAGENLSATTELFDAWVRGVAGA
ncbi:MAG: aminoglycoside/choline kinase family phosphotransferase [Hyphomicrobiaceae bacterium]|jgi:aminoglycoside/choline kinase family phosphotransferase